ncbi:MAG: formylmethanofuran dehydrogenase subunit B [Pirellulales bacterium]|nr:formylmethanofuran dehydrogenase subunit B [Pirellulales bacterium]
MRQTFSDVACTVCGCVCDDLRLTVEGGNIARAEGACKLAEPWFAALTRSPQGPAARVMGKVVSVEAAIDRAADLLRMTRAPLVWGLTRSSTAGQRAAIALAEHIGATIDTTASVSESASIMAIQQVGASTCSLGEVRHRADLVLIWGADPAESHPRLFERFIDLPAGLRVPHGRAERHVLVIDQKETATSRLADTFLRVKPDADFELICVLRNLLRGDELPTSCDVGISPAELSSLATSLRSCRYGVVFHGLGLAHDGGGHNQVEALLRLVKELNAHTRFAALRLGAAGNLAGAEAVLTWTTGFPFAVNMARGYPRYNPGEYTANERLERGEVDVCVLVGSESCHALSARARQTLESIPTIALDYPQVRPSLDATVQFTTGIYGIHAPGTAYRMDEVPIPLRQILPAVYPLDHEILAALSRKLLQ